MSKEDKYKIGMASKHSGVTPQTVRYYEKQEPFTSLKDDFSTTRYYGVRHFKWLSNIRRYFKCGFSEADVRELVNCENFEQMTGIIDRRIKESRRELQELRGRIEAMEWMSCNVKRIPSLLGRVVTEENPEISILITRRGGRMLEDAHTERVLAKWLDNIQMTALASVIPQSILLDEPESTYRLSGHCTLTRNLPLLGCDENDPAICTYKPRMCLHTVCELKGEDLSPKALMPYVYDYVRDFGLRICGDAFGQSLAVLKEAENAETSRPKAMYYEYWIPVCEI